MSRSWDKLMQELEELRRRLSRVERRSSGVPPIQRRRDRDLERKATRPFWVRSAISPDFGSAAFLEEGEVDHGNLAGLADDDHPHYLLIDGTRAMTGDIDMGTNAVTAATTIYRAVTRVTTDYTATVDDHLIVINGAGTITLPAGTDGQRFVVKQENVNETAYVEADGAEDFNEGTRLTLDHAGTEAVGIEWDGTTWQVLWRYQRDAADILTGFPIMMAVDALGSISNDGYAGFGRAAYQDTGDERFATLAPSAGAIHSLRAEISGAAVGAGEDWTFTLYKNGSPTDLTCTIGEAETSASDTTNRVTVAAGDYLTIFCDETGSLTNDVAITAIYESVYQPMFGYGFASTAYYGEVQNARYNSSGDVEAATVFPCSGTLQNFYLRAPSVNSTDEEITVTLREFDASAGTWSDVQAFTLNYNTDGSTKSDTSTTISVTAGKAYQWKFEDTSTASVPSISYCSISCELAPDTPGDIIITGYSDQFFSDPGYLSAMGGEQDDSTGSSALQANVQVPTSGTARDLYVVLEAAPGGSGDSYTFTLMKNGSTTSLAATVTDPSRTGSDTSNTVSFDGASDDIGLRVTDDSSVSPTWGAWGFLYR